MLLAITAASTVLLLRFCQHQHPARNMAAFWLHNDEDEEENHGFGYYPTIYYPVNPNPPRFPKRYNNNQDEDSSRLS